MRRPVSPTSSWCVIGAIARKNAASAASEVFRRDREHPRCCAALMSRARRNRRAPRESLAGSGGNRDIDKSGGFAPTPGSEAAVMSDLYLRSGIFLAPFHNHDENPTLSIERDLELLEHLDRLNYHEAWIGEHHSGGFELIACPEMFIAAAAQRTRHIRLGTGVVSLALPQPVHAGRPHGPARPHDARPGDVRGRPRRAGARRLEDRHRSRRPAPDDVQFVRRHRPAAPTARP